MCKKRKSAPRFFQHPYFKIHTAPFELREQIGIFGVFTISEGEQAIVRKRRHARERKSQVKLPVASVWLLSLSKHTTARWAQAAAAAAAAAGFTSGDCAVARKTAVNLA